MQGASSASASILAPCSIAHRTIPVRPGEGQVGSIKAMAKDRCGLIADGREPYQNRSSPTAMASNKVFDGCCMRHRSLRSLVRASSDIGGEAVHTRVKGSTPPDQQSRWTHITSVNKARG